MGPARMPGSAPPARRGRRIHGLLRSERLTRRRGCWICLKARWSGDVVAAAGADGVRAAKLTVAVGAETSFVRGHSAYSLSRLIRLGCGRHTQRHGLGMHQRIAARWFVVSANLSQADGCFALHGYDYGRCGLCRNVRNRRPIVSPRIRLYQKQVTRCSYIL